MARTLKSWRDWFGIGGAIGETTGDQFKPPGAALVEGTSRVGTDGALQIAAIWACIDRRATTIASLPFFAYRQKSGEKVLARGSRLYSLLHDSPNSRMTPYEFWRAMVMNHDLRGNAFARIDRDPENGEAIALWPMPSDQVKAAVLPDGSMVYEYTIGADVAVLSDANVLVIKNLGNGTSGLAKLEFMQSSVDEMAKAQQTASKLFGNGGKPTGVLMIDRVLTKEQRDTIRANMAGLEVGSTSRLMVLEAAMTYQQLSLTPEQMQIMEARQYGVEEICRWFDVPPVLIHHSNVTTWGSGIEQIVDGFHKFAIRPMAVCIEQAVTKRVLTPRQRASMSVEFSLDALLRGNAKDRAELYAKNVQNGIMTRNEVRQLENLAPDPAGDQLTAQSNLVPLSMLGQVTPGAGKDVATKEPIAN
jgi:HK97 family phage portal protein